ncbi:hypothetical protein DZD52_16830 [Xanthomonas nasturtii]|uniref:Uncharacterized protein n=1 Tax=Xanthomonas nasturtii TaxID=1843581 RepID=A0A3E1KFR9_9XANT|nr:hypothetical protein DZD52_16830 [Xanthomonas nasturtii]
MRPGTAAHAPARGLPVGWGLSSGIGNRESGIGNRESGIGNRESEERDRAALMCGRPVDACERTGSAMPSRRSRPAVFGQSHSINQRRQKRIAASQAQQRRHTRSSRHKLSNEGTREVAASQPQQRPARGPKNLFTIF